MSIAQTSRARDELRFQNLVDQTENGIEARLNTYVSLLRGTAGLFAASDDVGRIEFHRYVRRLYLTTTYPGIQGLGFTRHVREGEDAKVLAAMRRQGYPNFYFWPLPGKQSTLGGSTGNQKGHTGQAGLERHAILYIEPEDRRNSAALGFNMYSESTRRAAMARARDEGRAAASGKVTLVQEIDEEKQSGFLIYVPVYRISDTDNDNDPATVAQRRRLLTGFAYCAFRSNDLMRGVVPAETFSRLRVQIYDNDIVAPEHQMFDSRSSTTAGVVTPANQQLLSTDRTLRIAERLWRVHYTAEPAFERNYSNELVRWVLAGGVLLSLLLWSITRAQEQAKQRAERAAAELLDSQDALRQTEARARRLIESNVAAVMFTAADGCIVEANDALLKLLGYTRDDLYQQRLSWRDLTPPEWGEADEHALATIQQNGVQPPYEKEYLRRDGSRVPILVGSALLQERADTIAPNRPSHDQPSHDQPSHETRQEEAIAVSFVLDLSDLKRAQAEREALLERERRAREEAEAANRAKDEFLATLSHELRTPLNSILGWAQLMMQGRLDAQQSEQGLAAIERNANTQARLIEDLLDMSRIISGKLRIDRQTLSPASLLRAALDAVRPAAAAKGIRLESDIGHDIGPVEADPVRLQQIVWNLLNNAVKFTPENGDVFLRATNHKQSLEITVRDSGIGIAPEFLPHVFDRFRQADSSATRQHGGLGLGLSIVWHLVDRHGGTVDVHSEGTGRGATFTVTLPRPNTPEEPLRPEPPQSLLTPAAPTIASSAVPSAVTSNSNSAHRDGAEALSITAPDISQPQELESTRLNGIKVLWVEDEEDTCQLISFTLRRHGASIETAGDAAEALHALQKWRPTLLLSDIGLPGEDGYELVQKVRALNDSELAATPAIALTAYVSSDDRLRSLEAGFNVHLAKPVELGLLVDTLEQLAHASNGHHT
ncbi:MAG: hypothetical protein JWN98_435 [Abditibacteriota bacterium]|nr:hypothetical protein [Abditibacteriota bacterium]